MKRLKIIKKPKSYFKTEPNMKDYDKTRRKFKYKDYYSELDFFKGGKMNAAYNAIDRHTMDWRRNKLALLWVDDTQEKKYTFREMKNYSNRFANVLKKYGAKKGDRVFHFLPRLPEIYMSFLGTLKTGAIAGTMFAAFGPEAIRDRLQDSGAKFLVTNRELVKRVYKVKRQLPALKHIFIVDDKPRKKGEINYWEEMNAASRKFKVAEMKKTDPAFMLYTSGTTGKPKGVIHSHLAILHEHMTAKWVLDLHSEDMYWCTADPGWVTGIAYEILGSWSNKVTSLIYAGRFNPAKWYEIIEKYEVNIWYTAPTAVRMLMKSGSKLPKQYDLSSLRHMLSVGEPLNPEPLYWGLKVFGLPFHDNWWQTETGGILISNYPSMPVKPGSMGKPFPGINAVIIDDNGKVLGPGVEGNLAMKPGWPSMMKGIWKNKKKYNKYFLKGWYISGDKAMRDKDGYFWFIGRSDDVIKTSGERVGPFEVESALVAHPAIVEAAVIGKPDPLRGEIIKAFVTLSKGYKGSDALKVKIQKYVKKHLAGHAYPREIEFRANLPKTQSGKIIRRFLKAEEMGVKLKDLSTMAK